MVFVIDDVILAPFKLFTQVLEKIRDMAYVETYDLEGVKLEMEANEELYETGEITREEYEKRKSELMKKLERAERLEEALKGDRELYETGKITKEEFERRRSGTIDKLWRAERPKKERRTRKWG
ncbi:MAG: gas vesicle protein GvpG [Methanocellales archaeon]|nr:gas vesicle protein GvpG [Methanocellales archaeon]